MVVHVGEGRNGKQLFVGLLDLFDPAGVLYVGDSLQPGKCRATGTATNLDVQNWMLVA